MKLDLPPVSPVPNGGWVRKIGWLGLLVFASVATLFFAMGALGMGVTKDPMTTTERVMGITVALVIATAFLALATWSGVRLRRLRKARQESKPVSTKEPVWTIAERPTRPSAKQVLRSAPLAIFWLVFWGAIMLFPLFLLRTPLIEFEVKLLVMVALLLTFGTLCLILTFAKQFKGKYEILRNISYAWAACGGLVLFAYALSLVISALHVPRSVPWSQAWPVLAAIFAIIIGALVLRVRAKRRRLRINIEQARLQPAGKSQFRGTFNGIEVRLKMQSGHMTAPEWLAKVPTGDKELIIGFFNPAARKEVKPVHAWIEGLPFRVSEAVSITSNRPELVRAFVERNRNWIVDKQKFLGSAGVVQGLVGFSPDEEISRQNFSVNARFVADLTGRLGEAMAAFEVRSPVLPKKG